jgi:hypothetical protein
MIKLLLIFYLGLGLSFSLFLILTKELAVLDPNTRDSSVCFKLIIFPGMIFLWPFLIVRYIKQKK